MIFINLLVCECFIDRLATVSHSIYNTFDNRIIMY